MGLFGRIWKCLKKTFFCCGGDDYSILLNDDSKELELELTEISTFDLTTFQTARNHRLHCIEIRFQREKARMKAENAARRMENLKEIDNEHFDTESDHGEIWVMLEDRSW